MLSVYLSISGSINITFICLETDTPICSSIISEKENPTWRVSLHKFLMHPGQVMTLKGAPYHVFLLYISNNCIIKNNHKKLWKKFMSTVISRESPQDNNISLRCGIVWIFKMWHYVDIQLSGEKICMSIKIMATYMYM